MSDWRIMTVTCGGQRPTRHTDPGQPLLLVFPADETGEALAGAFAAENGAPVLGRITALRRDGADLIVTRNTHGGRLALEIRVSPCLAVATANGLDGTDGTLELGEPTDLELERTPLTDQGVSLEGARIVIGGGRGLDPDGFAQLDRIAGTLGAAVSASLPAVDLGFAPVSRQVGQSGKFVNPAIYFAAGMSGTPQHFAGVGAHARVLAVNPDRNAPIFGFAEAGALVDARELLPLLAAALEQMNKEQS
jgi:electron transfer flavoprotein alpha subunit